MIYSQQTKAARNNMHLWRMLYINCERKWKKNIILDSVLGSGLNNGGLGVIYGLDITLSAFRLVY